LYKKYLPNHTVNLCIWGAVQVKRFVFIASEKQSAALTRPQACPTEFDLSETIHTLTSE
jgi:hypothetical protein